MQQFNNFFMSDLGEVVALLIAGVLFIVLSGRFFKKAEFSTKALAYTGLAIAIAFVLSYVRLFSLPQGGSVTLMSMFFVSLVGFWFGPAVGLVSAISYGFLQIIQGAYVVHPIQLLLDYPVAFGLLGLAGFFYKMRWGLYIGFVVGCIGRFLAHTVSGYIFFVQYAPDDILGAGTWAIWTWSAAVNASVVFPEMALTLVIILIPVVKNALGHVRGLVVNEVAAAK